MSVLGRRVRPNQWNERTSGAAVYTTDVVLPGMLEARILRSPHPHADIRSIDTSRAEAYVGVAAVITADDLLDRTYLHLGEPFSDRSALARGRVRFIGEEVAAVAARTRADADAALDLIDVDYRLKDGVFTFGAARSSGAATVHDDVEGNLALQTVRSYGDPDAARSQAEASASGTYIYRPAAHVCLEPHSTVARWDPTRQQLDLWVSTQAPYFVRKEVAHLLDLDMDQVRTHPVAVGGGFGAKAKAGCHEVIAAALAIKTKQPVRLVLDRNEEFAVTAVRHAFAVDLATGARRDGTLTHRDGYVTVDNGAYNHAGPSVAIYATMLAAGPYRLEGCETAASLVYTNKQPGASFRGYGNPQMTFAMESQIDELADKLGMDGYSKWAYDYWHATDSLDPRQGTAHTTGDFSWIYRTSNDSNLEPITSVRLEMLRQGVQAYEKRRVLRDLLTDRNHASGLQMLDALLGDGYISADNAADGHARDDLVRAREQLDTLSIEASSLVVPDDNCSE